jgi:ABC-type transport system substrate-binding protein
MPPSGAAPSASPSAAVSEAPYREGLLGHPSSINPLTPRSEVDTDLVALLFRGLVRSGPDSSIVPDLAKSWTVSDDGRTYTFEMRDDAYWEDGYHVTADDVVFTVGLLQDSRYQGPAGASWQGIKATATGVFTVTFTLTLANVGFLRLAMQPILPEHLLKSTPVTELADSAYSAKPIGDGPYRILKIDYWGATLLRVGSVNPATSPGPSPSPTLSSASPSESQSAAPTASPAPSKASSGSASPSVTPTLPPTPAPTPSPTPSPSPTPPPTATPLIDLTGKTLSEIGTIELSFYDDGASAAADFRAGKLDAVGGLLPADSSAARQAAGSRAIPYQWASLLSVVVNQRPDHPEMRDANARTGLLAAIDRQKLLADVLGGEGSVADIPLPPWSPAYDVGSVTATPYSPSAATEFLGDAGWTVSNGELMAPDASTAYAMDLLTPNKSGSPVMFAAGQMVANSWRAIGLAVTVDAVPLTSYLSRLQDGTFDAAVVDFQIGLGSDLGPLLLSSQVGSGGSNVSGLSDRTLDQMLLTARKTMDPAARQLQLDAIESYLSTTIPVLPLAFREYELVVSAKVQKVLSKPIADPSGRYWDVIDWRLANDR